MFEDIKQHLFHYLILLVILFFGLFFFLLSSHRPYLQLQIVAVVAFLYILWGVVHHFLERDLTWLIVLEYFAIAALVMVVMYSLLTEA